MYYIIVSWTTRGIEHDIVAPLCLSVRLSLCLFVFYCSTVLMGLVAWNKTYDDDDDDDEALWIMVV